MDSSHTTRIESWRRDVAANLTQPVILSSGRRAHGHTNAAPVLVHVDDGASQQSPSTMRSQSVSLRHGQPRASQRAPPEYAIRYSTMQSPEATVYSTPRRSSLQPRQRVVYEYDSQPSSSLRTRHRTSERSTIATPQKASYPKRTQHSSSGYVPIVRQDLLAEPVYVSRRHSRPQPRKQFVVETTPSRRADARTDWCDYNDDAVGLEKKMKLLEIRDGVRGEVEKAREWAAHQRPPRSEDRRKTLYH